MMRMNIKKIAVLTSGGDSPGMNTALRAVVRTCAFNNIDCVGVSRGFQGLINDEIKILKTRSVRGIINRGGTMLYSARSDEFRTKEGREKAFENIKKHNIDAIVVIGGDGSFTGGLIFQKEFGIPIVGIPGTIDNDLFGTTHTLGYDTALNTVMEAIDKIRDTAISHDRLFFVEVMGRDAGHIALNSGVAIGAQEILIPERNNGIKELIKSLKESKKNGKTSNIVVVAEGDRTGENVFELAKNVEKKFPEYEIRVSVLGHMQRGGSPSCFDRVLGTKMGVIAVESLINGISGKMIGIDNGKIMLTSLNKAIKGETKIDPELLRISKIMNI
jgi:6-phosphofructokinase 1